MSRQGNLSAAERTHRKATQCKRGCVDEAYLNLGFVLRAQGKIKLAKRAFEKAIALDPAYAKAKNALEDVDKTIQYKTSKKTNRKRTVRRISKR